MEAHGGPGFSPFAGMPFGGIFDQLLNGPGGWSRALEYDPETGRWVDVTERGTLGPHRDGGA